VAIYITRRLLLLPVLLVGLSLITFVVSHKIPGNPLVAQLGLRGASNPQTVRTYRKKWGLDRSLPEQYVAYVGNLLHGDFGRSLVSQRPVSEDLKQYMPATIELAIASLFVAAVAQFRDEQIGALGAGDPTPEDVEEGLLQLGRRLMQLALSDEALSIIRLFLAEAPRVPDFARHFAESFPRHGLSGLSRFMRVYAERGVLSIDDPELAAQHFAMLVIAVPQRLAMLGHREGPEQQERRLRSAVKLFLDGCRRRP